MCYRSDREFSPLDAEDLQYQEDQYGDDILTLIKSVLYYLASLSDYTGYPAADIRGMAL